MRIADAYSILGVTPDTTREEIKRVYKRLASKWHPDKNKSSDATEKFKDIQVAFSTITKHLDNPHDDLNFDGLFSSMFGVNMHGGKMFYNINATWKQLYSGFVGKLNTGQSFSVPPATLPGTMFSLSRHKQNNDIIIRVITKDNTYQFNNNKLIKFVEIDWLSALLGNTLVVELLCGSKKTLKIPPKVKETTVFKIENAGWPKQGGGFTDLYVVPKIVEAKLSDEQIQTLSKVIKLDPIKTY